MTKLKDGYFTMSGAAKKMNVSIKTARKMVKSGILVPYRDDSDRKRPIFTLESVEKADKMRKFRHWTTDDIQKLVKMRVSGNSFKLIAKKLGRTEYACRCKFYEFTITDLQNYYKGITHKEDLI